MRKYDTLSNESVIASPISEMLKYAGMKFRIREKMKWHSTAEAL